MRKGEKERGRGTDRGRERKGGETDRVRETDRKVERGRGRKKRTNNHAGADVAELGFLAVVILELVRPVVGRFAGLGSRRLLPLLLLHLLVVDE